MSRLADAARRASTERSDLVLMLESLRLRSRSSGLPVPPAPSSDPGPERGPGSAGKPSPEAASPVEVAAEAASTPPLVVSRDGRHDYNYFVELRESVARLHGANGNG